MFSSNQDAELSLNVPVRALDAVKSDKVETKFIVGSCSVQGDNHLHLLRFHSEANQMTVDAVLPHSTGPVAGICTSPSDKSYVLTYAENDTAATLWKIPREIMDRNDDVDFDNDDLPDSTSVGLEESVKLSSNSKIVEIVWRGAFDEEPSAMGDVLTLDQTGTLSQWDVSFGSADATRTLTANVKDSKWNLPPQLVWDPHSVNTVAVSSGSKVGLLDLRGSTDTVQSFQCHRYGITDLDYNPNKPHVLTTAGQDGLLKFWDLRSTKQPILVSRGGHRHWVSRVCYNPFHDQLLLSAGTDSLVNLWRFSTISSAPLLNLDDPNDENSGPNIRVSQHEHMDSVYAISWGAADAWVYASVGYDGKAILSHVPSKEKYKILL
jgi:WD40 repeat protein